MWVKVASLFVASFVVALSGALMPGPLTITAIERAVRFGVSAGLLVAIGHAALELPTTIALSLGLHLTELQILKAIISFVGGVVFVLMGISMLGSSVKEMNFVDGEVRNVRANIGSLLAGVVSSISNPYWFVWWVTIGASMIVTALNFGWVGVWAFYVGHILGDVIWLSIVSMAVRSGVKLLGGSAYNVLIKICGVFIICFGCVLLLVAVRSMLSMVLS